MALPQVAILSSPRCAHNKKFMPLMRAKIAKSKNIFHFELDTDTAIPEALSQFARTKPALLIINGGDTTIHTTLNHLKNKNLFAEMPVLAVLASGKANKLAHDLGLGGKPVKVLEKLIHLAQVEGMDSHITQKNLIKLEVSDNPTPYYGVYFKAGAVVEQVSHFKSALMGLKLPKFLAAFFAYFWVLILSLGRNGKRHKDKVSYVAKCKIMLKGAGELSGHCFTLLATTLDKLPSGRTPFGRFGKGYIGFLVVEYGFMSGLRAIKGLAQDRLGRVSILGVDTRRSNELSITGLRKVSLDGEFIEIAEGASLVLNGTESLPFINLRNSKD